MNRVSRWMLLATLGAASFGAGCPKKLPEIPAPPPVPPSSPGENAPIGESPYVPVPGPASGARATLKLGKLELPEGASATLPAHDGEPLLISYPSRKHGDLLNKEVLATVVAPVFRAL